MELYERFGVPEYWYVDLESDRVEVYRLEGERFARPLLHGRRETLASSLLANFEIGVDEILGPAED